MKQRNPRPFQLPDDPRKWTAGSIARVLGFATTREFVGAVQRIESYGYSLFRKGGAKKRRLISNPSPWLKAVLRDANNLVWAKLPPSPYAYDIRGRGAALAARQHLGKPYMVILDVADCFPSTTHTMVRTALLQTGAQSDVANLLARLATFRYHLPQGAPTSSTVLNVVFRPIDERIAAVASSYSAVFTRYVDDIAISSDYPLTGLLERLTILLGESGYSVNERKVRVYGPEDVHIVMGVVVGDKLSPSARHLNRLHSELARIRRGVPSLRSVQLEGSLNWAALLDSDLGASLRAKLARARAVALMKRQSQ